jgi:RNA polymerase sigma factor (sigma-70 family)
VSDVRPGAFLDFANDRRFGGLFLLETRMEQGVIEPTFDWREQLEGSASGAAGDSPESLADGELLRRYRDARDPAAFTAMVRRHQPMVLRACLRLTGNVHDAEDAAQSVFLVLSERPQVVRRSLAGCLHGLARAAVSELRRARRRRNEREELAARLKSMFARLHRESVPMQHDELREELDSALAQLPDPLQQAVILRYLEGLSQQAAAKRAGCTTTTMGWRSMKGLQRLRTALGRRGVVVTSAALLALLSAEAGSSVAQGLAGAAAGPASASAARVAATLVKRSLLLGTLRRAAVALLVTAGVALGVGIAVKLPPAPAEAPNPELPAPASQAPRQQAGALGLFDDSKDIGAPAHAGAARLSGEVYTVRGGGKYIYEDRDQFRFVYRRLSGDGEISARVTSDPEQPAHQVAAGVMFREQLTPTSHHATILVDNIHCDVKYRTGDTDPGSGCDISDLDAPGRQWVRLVRRGDTFRMYVRPDGTETWKLVKELELVMNRSLYVGLAVTAHDDAQLATTTFDHVAVRAEK